MSHLYMLLIAMGLVLLNAFFVAAEFGMVKLRQTRVMVIKKIYGFRGKILAQVHQHLDAYLSACQLGITFASLGLGWVGEPAFAFMFFPVFALFGITSPQAIHAAALTSAFIFITFLHIVLGELLPKSIAIRASERVSLWTAFPLYLFYWIMYPIIWIMNSCSNLLLKLTEFGKVRVSDYFYDTDEIKMILSSSYLHGELTKDEKRILEHTLDLGDLRVTDVMRPIDEMVTLSIQEPISAALNTMVENRYSRYPVYDESSQQIIGIIHVKDVFSELYRKQEISSLKEILRPVLKVARRLPAFDLLRKFREGMPHFALVYSGTEENVIGFVTLDNLLHILIGRIKDEFHRTRDDWKNTADGAVLIPGNASIYSLERSLNIDIEQEDIEENIDTITGLILSRLGSVPKNKEKIRFKQFEIEIVKMRGPKILEVKVYLIHPPEEE